MKTPRQYQIESISAAIDHNVLIADECGLGKTFQGVRAIDLFQETLQDKQRQLPVLIVCRKKARQQWADEINEETNRVAIILDRVLATPIKQPLWIITHYESITRDVDKWQKAGPYAAIILDEAHVIKGGMSGRKTTQITTAMNKLRALRKIALTGTPIDRSAAEAWSILHWLYPERYKSYWRFFDQYANYQVVWIGKGRQIRKPAAGTRDPVGFACELSEFTFQRTKAQVLPQLPPKIEKTIMLDLDGYQGEIYEAIDQCDDIECILPTRTLFIPNQLAKITLLQQITSHPEIVMSSYDVLSDLDRIRSTKLDWLIDYLNDNPTVPMVIFTRFKLTQHYIESIVKSLGRTDILVGTIDSIGESLNLQWASVAIFYDLHWSSIKMRQAIDRIHRMDITESKYIIYLIAANTIDELMMQAINAKWSEQELIRHYLHGHQQVVTSKV
jgi:SNF2 family DNA or RNA helicase